MIERLKKNKKSLYKLKKDYHQNMNKIKKLDKRLKTIKEDDILILLNGEVKPIVIKSVKDESLIQLILPIKTY